MADKTVINPALQQSAQTALNQDVVEEYNRQNNIDSSEYLLIPDGTTLLDRYVITGRLEVNSGEADLYKCEFNDSAYVAKVYRRKFAVKQEVLDKLLTINSPYIARLQAGGEYKGRPVEIMPYYEKGSLQGRKYTEDELKRTVIPDVNEALHTLHEAGIFHKDLKPSNIMLNSDGESVAIIDFGISSAVESKDELIITKTGMTPAYSAPETFKGMFYEGSDYYSFGITLFELFCGYAPYDNMTQEEIEQYASIQQIPFPDDMSAGLQDFISALTYRDIGYRNNKNNPNRRWTYDEVKRWLAGEDMVIPGEGIGNAGKGAMPVYEFMGENYTDPAQLVTAFARHWEEGKKQLFRSCLTVFFRKYNQDMARKCQAAEEQAGYENGRDDIIFWRLLYQLNPKLQGLYWKGRAYESLAAFGREALEKLWDNDNSDFNYYGSILDEKLLSQFVIQAAPKNEKLKKAAAAIEDSYKLEKTNGTDMRRTYYLMAYTLSGQKLLMLDGEKYRTVGELVQYMRSVLDDSYERFEALCHRLVDYNGNLDFQLETWLIAIGKQKEIEKWRESMNE